MMYGLELPPPAGETGGAIGSWSPFFAASFPARVVIDLTFALTAFAALSFNPLATCSMSDDICNIVPRAFAASKSAICRMSIIRPFISDASDNGCCDVSSGIWVNTAGEFVKHSLCVVHHSLDVWYRTVEIVAATLALGD
jgi:hypothetical protein